VAEVPQLLAALGEERARDGLALDHFLLELGERRVVKRLVRVGVVAEFQPRPRPRAQGREPLLALPRRFELPLVDEADGRDFVRRERRDDLARVVEHGLAAAAPAVARDRQIVERDGHAPARASLPRRERSGGENERHDEGDTFESHGSFLSLVKGFAFGRIATRLGVHRGGAEFTRRMRRGVSILRREGFSSTLCAPLRELCASAVSCLPDSLTSCRP
jgi:hypothetical protein